MRRLLVFVLLIVAGRENELYSQKPPLDLEASMKWTTLSQGGISNDGKYVWYDLFHSEGISKQVIVQSINGNWKKTIVGGDEPVFSGDSKYLFLKKGSDSLGLINLKEEKHIEYVTPVTDYKLSNVGEWFAWKGGDTINKLKLRQVDSGKEKEILNVKYFSFADDGNAILVSIEDKDGSTLKWVDLGTWKWKEIWRSKGSEHINNYSITLNAGDVAFIVEIRSEAEKLYELFFYKEGMDQAEKLVDGKILRKYSIANSGLKFNADASRIYFNVVPLADKVEKLKSAVSVDVWSYLDVYLPNTDRPERSTNNLTAVINVKNRKLLVVEREDERLVSTSEDFVVVEQSGGNSYETNWNRCARLNYYLISLEDGSRRLIRQSVKELAERPWFSPTGRWLFYYDVNEKDYFSHDPYTGIVRNVTNGVNERWESTKNEWPEVSLAWAKRKSSWLKNDNAVLINDENDIWLVDPEGMKDPVNFTNKYGRKYGLRFSILDDEEGVNRYSIRNNPELVIQSFNTISKEIAFFKKRLNKEDNPVLLSKGNYNYGLWIPWSSERLGPVLKAKNAQVYFDLRMSTTEAPNWFLTKDFKEFKFLTTIEPQEKYNWFSTELITWTTLNGSRSQGILYKPEDFDPRKSYPLIINFYERKSDNLNVYFRPMASTSEINIPLFVSNGYLVFTPDIQYELGKPGESAYNSVISGVQSLTKYSWVDKDRIGIQGHSFGGFETLYLITHTKVFRAACSAAGLTNYISWYGSAARGSYAMFHSEQNQGRIGGTLWERQGEFIENSPVLKANKITTPLLMMHNKKDRNVPFAQGMEMFTALRRLGKKVWTLQYENGTHEVEIGRDADDYHTRMMQFFDHYLKDSACPRWMLYGISAKDKGYDDGLKLVKDKDKNSKWVTPPESGLLTLEERKAVEALQTGRRLPNNQIIQVNEQNTDHLSP